MMNLSSRLGFVFLFFLFVGCFELLLASKVT